MLGCTIGAALWIFILTGCSSVETTETVEAYVIKTLEQTSGEGAPFVETGFQKVNVISKTEVSKNHIKTDIKAIEDYYDINGKYIKTVILHSTLNKSYITDAEKEDRKTEELDKPATILLPEGNMKEILLDNLPDDKKNQVKMHVLSMMD
jgi:hypothetical protein